MDKKLEKLLAETDFVNLTVEDKDYVLRIMTEQEFLAFKNITGRAGYVLKEDFIKIKPDPKIRHNLSQAYRRHYGDKTFKKEHVILVGIEKLMETPFCKFGILGLFCVLLIFSVWIFWDGGLGPNNNAKYSVMDQNQIDRFYEMNSYLYLNESGLDVEIIVPGIHDAPMVFFRDSLLIP
jgi:hypothetical protein